MGGTRRRLADPLYLIDVVHARPLDRIERAEVVRGGEAALRIVADQIGAPTPRLSTREAWRSANGTYHLTTGGETSWHGFATAIVAAAREVPRGPAMAVKRILPIAAGPPAPELPPRLHEAGPDLRPLSAGFAYRIALDPRLGSSSPGDEGP